MFIFINLSFTGTSMHYTRFHKDKEYRYIFNKKTKLGVNDRSMIVQHTTVGWQSYLQQYYVLKSPKSN